jgi:Icc-related predicted phosphoesterase
MIIDCISDLHGYYPELEGGDLLIVAGDLTKRDKIYEYIGFNLWLDRQKYSKKIVIAGNHDNQLQLNALVYEGLSGCNYLCDSGTEFEGLKIWGSPWSKTFPGINPQCKAFTCDTEEDLKKRYDLIPDDIDILVTHSPPFEVRDEVKDYHSGKILSVGSKSLEKRISELKNLKLHVFGHIHENGGQKMMRLDCRLVYINASHVNEHYKPVNKPIRIEL